jgi:uncharacterized LabA/DUF88 family protein
MARVVFLVDGFNLYHALRAKREFEKYRWLDLARLCKCFMKKSDQLGGVYYFTSLATWDAGKARRHRTYIQALHSSGVNVVYGEFKLKDKVCRICRRTYQTFEEKQTDVNIAIHLFRLAMEDIYDTATIISGDSDLIPSIVAVKQVFPGKQIGIVLPIGRASESLKLRADFHMRMKRFHLESSTFSGVVNLAGGGSVKSPDGWL